jgi:hypothetical protein
MRLKSLAISVAVAGFLIAALPVLAHHSFAAEYDSKAALTLKGVVTKVEWLNPHAYFYMDVKDDSGKVVNWAIENGPPNMLYRNGWRKDSLKPGDMVTVDGFRAKDGTTTASARLVQLPDGRKVFSGSADDGGPGAKTTR